MEIQKPEVVSVKFHFQTYFPIHQRPEYLTQYTSIGNNFYTIAYESYRFTIFPCSKYVNVSGLSFFEEVHQAIDTFENILETRVKLNTVKVDNSTAVGSLSLTDKKEEKLNLDLYSIPIALQKAQCQRKKWKNCSAVVRPSKLPCAILRRTKKPTINIFPSGKFVILGGKCQKEVLEANLLIQDMAPFLLMSNSDKKIINVTLRDWC